MSVGVRRAALAMVLAAVAIGAIVSFRLETEVATWSGPQLAGNWDVIAHWFVEHVRFTLTAVAAGTLISMPLAYVSIRWPRTYPAMLTGTNILYAVPSIALIVMLASLNTEVLGIKFSYLSDAPVVVAMALYTLIILVRNIVEAVRAVPDPVVRAADGMGYRRFVRFATVELPLALPGIIAGLRLATVSTVSLISVGALSGRGGLGRLFADGRRRGIVVELWSGIVAIVVLALVLDAILVLIGWLATPWTHPPAPDVAPVACHRQDPGEGRVVRTILDGFGWLTTADNWWGRNGLAVALGEHVRYSLYAVLGAIAIGFPIGLAIGHTGRGRFVAANMAGLWRAIPTLGVVGVLFDWKPLTLWPVLVALVVLAVPPIVLNTAAGIDAVPADVRDAAHGMGLTGWQALWQVEVPNALPLILAGVRSAANQVIATATIAGWVGLGTFGVFIFSGIGTREYDKVAGASIAVIALVLVVEALFATVQRFVVGSGGRGGKPL